MFVHNDQPTARVAVADVARLAWGTDMNISFLFYFDSGTLGRTDLIKCFVAVAKGCKTGRMTFIRNQFKLQLWQGRGGDRS